MTNDRQELRHIGPFPSIQLVPTHPGVAETENHELAISPAVAAAPGSHTLSYHGGPTIQSPKLWLVYLGAPWFDKAKFEQCARELMEYGYLSKLGWYGSGNGTYLGAVQGPTVSGVVTDAQLQQVLRQVLTGGAVSQPDGHTLYVLVLPDGATSQMAAGQLSCGAFCGYHSSLDALTYYSVHPATKCVPCHGDWTPEDALHSVLAHEIAEACSDPTGQGWYEDAHGDENGDLDAWVKRQYGPWTVQGYYTNEEGGTLGAYQPPVPVPLATRVFADRWTLKDDGGWNTDSVELTGPEPAGAYYNLRTVDGDGTESRSGGFQWVAAP